MRVFVTLEFTFMRTYQQIPFVFIQNLLCNIRTKTTSTTSIFIENLSWLALWITP